MTYESTLELEKKGDYLGALNKCNEAKALYDGLSYNFPQFQPEIVKFKQKIVADTRLRILESDRRRKAGVSPDVPPAPKPGQNINQSPELPNVETPGSSMGNGISIQQPNPEAWKDRTGNVLPSWSHNPQVGRQANSLLSEVQREEQRKDSIIKELKRENDRLMAERRADQARMKDIESQLARSQQKALEYRRQLDAYERDPNNQNYRIKAERLRALLEDAMSELQASTRQNAELVNRLRTAQATIRQQDAQIRELEEERDNLAKIIQGKGVGSEALQDLMNKNRKLTERLALLEKVAQRTSNDNKQKEQDIALLKAEVEKVKVERDRLVVENVKHQQQIEGLQKKLEMLSDGLSEEDKQSLANMAPEQKAENELLRSMVLKQLRRQAQLKQAKELLLRQLDRVGARSNALMEVVEDMARGPQLSPEEKALVREPEFAELMEDAVSGGGNGSDGYGRLSAPASSGSSRHVQQLSEELAQLDKAARLDFQEGRYAEAEQGFLKYLHFRPRNVPCLCNLGILKISTEDYHAAQQYLQKAIAIDKSSGLAYYLMGRTYFLQDKYDEALTNLEQGIQLEPRNASAHNCVGVIASKKGWVSRAEKAFSEAVNIDPKMGDAHFNLAVLFSSQSLDNFEKAYKHYYRAMELKVPRDAWIENYLKVKNAERMKVGMR
ncbi:MAG: tetratricopeptide repeat protein [Verrucomicrobiales bacterium]|nr:tetratricopeptide repeat protein [Verrucomicrobiales bacterium]